MSINRIRVAARVVWGTAMLLLALSTSAGGMATNATITKLHFAKSSPNLVFIELSALPAGRPSCSIHNWAFTLALNTAFEAKIFATLVAAHAAKAPVNLYGSGFCAEHGEGESLEAAQML